MHKLRIQANTSDSLFMKTLEGAELTGLIGQMQQRKPIAIENGIVSYRLPVTQH